MKIDNQSSILSKDNLDSELKTISLSIGRVITDSEISSYIEMDLNLETAIVRA